MAPAGTFPQLRPALQDAGPWSQPGLEPPCHCALAPSTAGCGAQAHAPPPLPAPRVPARAPTRVPSTVLKFVPFTFIILLFVLHLTLCAGRCGRTSGHLRLSPSHRPEGPEGQALGSSPAGEDGDSGPPLLPPAVQMVQPPGCIREGRTRRRCATCTSTPGDAQSRRGGVFPQTLHASARRARRRDGPNVRQRASGRVSGMGISQPWEGVGSGACCKTRRPWGAAQGPGLGQDGGPSEQGFGGSGCLSGRQVEQAKLSQGAPGPPTQRLTSPAGHMLPVGTEEAGLCLGPR